MDPADLAGSAPTGSDFAGSGPGSTFELDPSSGQRRRDPTKTDPAGLVGSASGLHHDDELSKIKMEIEWDWVIWMQLVGKETGLGWNHARGTIDASLEWWEEKLKVLPEAAKFRDTGLENAALLQVMFSKTVALGDTAWTPALGTMPPDPFRSRDLEEGSGDSGDDINVATINLEPGDSEMSSNTTSDSNSIEDESDSEDERNCEVDKIRKFYMTATVGVAVCANYYAKYLMKQNPRTSTLSGWQWVQEILRTPGESYRMLRMESEVFKRLASLLTNNYGLHSTRAMHAEEALAIFLLVCGHNETNRNIQNRFKHSGETISRKFNEVLDSLVRFSVDIIKPLDPSFTTIPPQIRNNVRFWPHFEGAIGAIDGTLIRAVIPKEDQIPYIGRQPYPMQNIMAVCDFNMVFTFVVAGWPGATHDARIFTTTLNNYGHIFPHPPEGKYYLVDAGYPNIKGYLGPYTGGDVRYHIHEFKRGSQPRGYKEVFNHAHSSLRNVIERSFGVLKAR
uniref:Uncharacterized protein n=1 Tax=Ananas comosus var. bracteatus TaxID=296719 RepID=A0A6V7P1P6_ANACO|nr:unnamed protein product [Ananas comosus var. bracteatus]